MGLSSSPESGHARSHSFNQQSISEHIHGLSSECIHAKSLAPKSPHGSEVHQYEPGKTVTSVSGSTTLHENLQPSSGDVARNSISGHLSLSSDDMDKYGQNDKRSSCQQDMPEKILKFGTQCIHTGSSEPMQQLGYEIAQNEPGETTTAVPALSDENLQPFSKGVAKSSFSEPVEQPPGDVSKSGLIDKVSSCQVTTSVEAVGPRSAPAKLGVEHVHEGPSDMKHNGDCEISENERGGSSAAVFSHFVTERLQQLSVHVAEDSPCEHLQPPPEDVGRISQTGESSCPPAATSERTLGLGLEDAGFIPSEVKHKLGSEVIRSEPMETSTVMSGSAAIKRLVQPPEFADSSLIDHSGESVPPPEDMVKNVNLVQLETGAKNTVKNSKHSGCKGKRTSKMLKKKYMLRSSLKSERILRSGSREKPKGPEPRDNLVDVSSGPSGAEKKRKRKKEGIVKPKSDEYSRIRMHLRYFLSRMNYEQSLIAAYSAEGWKGLSLEKLKPEKELQRATSEILRRKLRIRDLFQHIDSLCAQGRFPESLFDSEGQISSEDIFCAKCGSKDLSADNDIILCDGACDRGFHQFCLEPPLLKEDIPPDDEGWLCPGCDCKDDCLDLLNESQGTNLSITDSWEKVFPEAAAAAVAAGCIQDPNFGLPSDDSDDDDYNPDGPDTDENDQQDKSSSDESDFTSASDELEASLDNEQYLGLPSDDSEDEDYDPTAPDLDQKIEQESSSSDFTSDSEDLGAAVEENGSTSKDEVPMSVSLPGDSNGQRSKLHGEKKHLNDELLSMLEVDPRHDGSASVSKKRSIERLDYRKLYDETYGNIPSSSSDDEDWADVAAPKPGRESTREVASKSTNGTASIGECGKSTGALKWKIEETKHTPQRITRQQSKFKDKNVSSAASHVGSSKSSSCGERMKSSAHRRLGEAVTQRLYKSFRENQYPDRATKESLARELEITFHQVSKWFENTRWSFNHSSSAGVTITKTVSKKDIPSPQTSKSLSKLGPETVSRGAQIEEPSNAGAAVAECSSRDAGDTTVLATHENSRLKSTTTKSRNRKRKSKADEQASDPESTLKGTQKFPADSIKAQEMQTGGRIRTKRRK